MMTHRLATSDELPALAAVMDAAIRELQAPFLDADQIAASRTIMGLDAQLIDDRTHVVVEIDGAIAGCGAARSSEKRCRP